VINAFRTEERREISRLMIEFKFELEKIFNGEFPFDMTFTQVLILGWV